jgi:hypothetical protein
MTPLMRSDAGRRIKPDARKKQLSCDVKRNNSIRSRCPTQSVVLQAAQADAASERLSTSAHSLVFPAFSRGIIGLSRFLVRRLV